MNEEKIKELAETAEKAKLNFEFHQMTNIATDYDKRIQQRQDYELARALLYAAEAALEAEVRPKPYVPMATT